MLGLRRAGPHSYLNDTLVSGRHTGSWKNQSIGHHPAGGGPCPIKSFWNPHSIGPFSLSPVGGSRWTPPLILAAAGPVRQLSVLRCCGSAPRHPRLLLGRRAPGAVGEEHQSSCLSSTAAPTSLPLNFRLTDTSTPNSDSHQTGQFSQAVLDALESFSENWGERVLCTVSLMPLRVRKHD